MKLRVTFHPELEGAGVLTKPGASALVLAATILDAEVSIDMRDVRAMDTEATMTLLAAQEHGILRMTNLCVAARRMLDRFAADERSAG